MPDPLIPAALFFGPSYDASGKRRPVRGRTKRPAVLFTLLTAAVLMSGCVSHLQEAKAAFTRGRESAREYREADARAEYQRACREAGLETRRRPSAQAFLIKGLAEIQLERWNSAAESFRAAFSLGFDGGESWAEELALYGLAVTLLETGMERSAEDFLKRLVDKSRNNPVLRLAARGYADLILARAAAAGPEERESLLRALLKTAVRLVERDPACGYHRYVLSQVHGFLEDDRSSLEAAVLAKELGLPSIELLRDNDNQIVFCYRRLAAALTGTEKEKFLSGYLKWVERWGWPGPEIPEWRK